MSNKLVFLKTDEDFANFRRSRLATSRNLKLRVHFNTNQNTIRFGFIIPKKALAKASDRNKLKRRLKSLMEKHLSSLKKADLLWLPQKSALKIPFRDLEDEAVALFKTARIWNS
jgi:ribonuclease P protein component